MQITVGALSDVGRERQRNEDSFLADDNVHLYIVCDGMGGHAGGDVASATAVQEIRKEITGHTDLLRAYARERLEGDRRELLKTVERAIHRACLAIYERGLANPHERGMGTTASLILLCGGRAFIGHVGDSRIYLRRHDELHQLTEDHSLLAEMVRSGRVKSAADVDPRFRNAVTRAVGVHETVEVDTVDLDLLPGDKFLLCSDGLTGYANVATLSQILAQDGSEADICKALVALANQRGGSDNITAVLVTVVDPERENVEELALELETLRHLTLFRYLSYAELVRVLNIAEEQDCAQGEAVFRHGDHGRCAYIILRGRVQVRSGNVIIALLQEGRHFGEMALVDNEPRAADAIAVENTRLLVIPRTGFHELMRRNPLFAVKMLWSFIKAMTGRLRYTTGELSVVKSMFYSRSPQDADKLPASWLPPDALEVEPAGPRGDIRRPAQPPAAPPPVPARARSTPPSGSPAASNDQD